MKERSAMSTAKRVGMSVRVLVIGGALLIGGVLFAGPAAADEEDTVGGCPDTSGYSLEQADAASGSASLAQADERSGRIGMTALEEGTENAGMTAIDEMSGTTGMTELEARDTSWVVHCNM